MIGSFYATAMVYKLTLMFYVPFEQRWTEKFSGFLAYGHAREQKPANKKT